MGDPEIRLADGTTWKPWHRWDDENSQVDARIVDADGNEVANLDVVAAGDPDIDESVARRANSRWATGGVYVHEQPVRTLVVPGDTLSGPMVREALERWMRSR